MSIEISENLKKLAKLFPCELYIVGGYIRNSIMGIEKEDVDICSKLTIEEVEKLLNGTVFDVKVKSKTLGSLIIS